MSDIAIYIKRLWKAQPHKSLNWQPEHEEALRRHLEQAEQIIAQAIATNEPPTDHELGFLQNTLGWSADDIQEETNRVAAKLRGQD